MNTKIKSTKPGTWGKSFLKKSAGNNPGIRKKHCQVQSPFDFNLDRIAIIGNIQPKLFINHPNDKYEQEADRVADRVMRMESSSAGSYNISGGKNGIQRKCTACEKEKEKLHRKPQNTDTGSYHPPITSPALQSQLNNSVWKGSPLPRETNEFMSRAIGADFSGVRIHTGNEAVRMNQEINARAFTHGSDIYFNKDEYNPGTIKGKYLLAHELTHVVQQEGTHQTVQRKRKKEDCFSSARYNRNISPCPEGAHDVGRQAQGQRNTIDARANAIISTARDPSVPLQERALRVVNDIICTYMPSQVSKVRKLLYFPGQSGLQTQRVGSGATAKGDICVGDYFVTHTTRSGMARRVVQVAHELQHIDQYRSGMTGSNRSDQREFLAFYNEALADEFIGTGRMADAMRRSLIDVAIGYYHCLNSTLQTQYSGRLQTLLARRQTVNGTHGNTSTTPPSGCRRQA